MIKYDSTNKTFFVHSTASAHVQPYLACRQARALSSHLSETVRISCSSAMAFSTAWWGARPTPESISLFISSKVTRWGSARVTRTWDMTRAAHVTWSHNYNNSGKPQSQVEGFRMSPPRRASGPVGAPVSVVAALAALRPGHYPSPIEPAAWRNQASRPTVQSGLARGSPPHSPATPKSKGIEVLAHTWKF